MTDEPLELPRWTLAQTLAWIIHRTPEAVLETLMNMSVFDVADKAAILTFDKDRDDQEMARPADDFRPADKFGPDRFRRDELRDRLKDGTLTAYGIRDGQFKHSEIPKIDWDTIDSFYIYYENSRIGPRDVGSSNECSPRYRDVFVFPSDALRLWADPASGEKPRTVEGEMSETAPGTPISPVYPPMSESDTKGKLPPFLKELKVRYQQDGLRFNQDVARAVASDHFKRFIDRERFRVAYRDAGLNQLGGRPRKTPPKS
jgi:hypothetical protein